MNLPEVLQYLSAACLMFGAFFMLIGAIGIVSLPDVFNRMHAGSKCITLGLAGISLALIVQFAILPLTTGQSLSVQAITKVAIVLLFQFVAAPVGAHLLSRAAHLDRASMWEGTLSDELRDEQSSERSGVKAGGGRPAGGSSSADEGDHL